MKQGIVRNFQEILKLLDDTKKQVATSISEDVMNGVYTISEETQRILKLVSTTETDFGIILSTITDKEIDELRNSSTQSTITPSIKEESKQQVIAKKEEVVISASPVVSVTEEIITPTSSIVKEDVMAREKEDDIIVEPEAIEKDDDDESGFSFSDLIPNLGQSDEALASINEPTKETYESKESDVATDNSVVIKEDVLEEDVEPNSEEVSQVIHSSSAQVIGESLVQVEPLPFYGEVTNERRKLKGDFIFDHYRIMATHPGSSSSSDIRLYVAPLQVIPNNPNVPIIVHAYSHGKYVTASSYDTKDSGRSIVAIEIDEFCLLIRGGFDENGVFTTFVFTTGFSASQGDSLTFVSKDQGYTGPNPVGSGHIKFKEGENVFELFPLSLTDTEYLCIMISKEFVDYHVVALNYGSPRIKIYGSTMLEVIAGWSGDSFEADII